MNPLAQLALFVLLVSSPFFTGCGSSPGELAGSVTYKGKAVVAGTVTAYDSEQNAYQGVIEQGRYSIQGIPPGTIQLVVLSPNPKGPPAPKLPAGVKQHKGGREPREPSADEAQVVGWVPLPKKYEDLATSPLKTDVKAGPNTFDIEVLP